MSDHEGHGGPPGSDDDLSLPKATVAKMITGEYMTLRLSLLSVNFVETLELLPKDVSCAKDTRDLVIECCVGKVLQHPHSTSLFLKWTFHELQSLFI